MRKMRKHLETTRGNLLVAGRNLLRASVRNRGRSCGHHEAPRGNVRGNVRGNKGGTCRDSPVPGVCGGRGGQGGSYGNLGISGREMRWHLEPSRGNQGGAGRKTRGHLQAPRGNLLVASINLLALSQ